MIPPIGAQVKPLRRRSKWQQKRREDINKDPGGEDEKEHGLPHCVEPSNSKICFKKHA